MLQKKRGGRRGEAKKFQAEVQGDTEKLQKRERNGLTTWADGESYLSRWGRGHYAEFAAAQKAAVVGMEWSLEARHQWPRRVSQTSFCFYSAFCFYSILIVVMLGFWQLCNHHEGLLVLTELGKPYRAICGTKAEYEVCFSTIEYVVLVNFKALWERGKEIWCRLFCRCTAHGWSQGWAEKPEAA